jgi:hypothetical protein
MEAIVTRRNSGRALIYYILSDDIAQLPPPPNLIFSSDFQFSELISYFTPHVSWQHHSQLIRLIILLII